MGAAPFPRSGKRKRALLISKLRANERRPSRHTAIASSQSTATVAAPRPHCHRIVTVNAAAVTAPRPHCHRIAVTQSTLPTTAIALPQLPSQHRGRTATAMQRLPSHCRHSQRSCRHSTEAALRLPWSDCHRIAVKVSAAAVTASRPRLPSHCRHSQPLVQTVSVRGCSCSHLHWIDVSAD